MLSNSDTLITVFGGSGFIGRHVVRALAKRDFRIRVAVRRPELAGHLQPLGKVGQIHAVQANVRYPTSVAAAMRDSHIVINLVGILAESGAQTFDAVQAEGAETIAQAAAALGAKLIHMSAIGADAESASAYARSKAAGEAAVRAAFPAAVILRPSVVFGPEDSFFNRFAGLAATLPVMPVFSGATKFQPVYVGDVADAVMAALQRADLQGRTFELGGPQVWTMREILTWILAQTQRNRCLVNVPMGLARLEAAVLEKLPGKLLTRDQLLLLARDNVVAPGAAGFDQLGIAPLAVAQIVPQYLARFRVGGKPVNTYAA